jgi:hypothetical protein
MAYCDVEIEPDDYLTACSSREIELIIKYLKEDGYLDEENKNKRVSRNIQDDIWYEMCDKLADIRLQMSIDDENTIRSIIEKY